MNPYHVIRRIHLFAGLVLLVWVLMYFVTGWIMVHEDRFPRGDRSKSTYTAKLAREGDKGTPEFVQHLETVFEIHGKRQEPKRQKDGTWRFNWVRPGEVNEVVISADGLEAKVTRRQSNLAGVAHGLHRLHGYGGGLQYDVWVFFYDLASVSMIVFSLSGIWLWWKTATTRLAGYLCLAASFGFAGAMIAYLMLSK